MTTDSTSRCIHAKPVPLDENDQYCYVAGRGRRENVYTFLMRVAMLEFCICAQ